jgi:hypothetical protein
MTEHRHPRCITPAPGVAVLPSSDVAMIRQLNSQLIEANRKLALAHLEISDLRRKLAERAAPFLLAAMDVTR